MYCPLNYRRAQFTHDIHLDQPWSKVGSRDLQRAPHGVRGGLGFSHYFTKLGFEVCNKSNVSYLIFFWSIVQLFVYTADCIYKDG